MVLDSFSVSLKFEVEFSLLQLKFYSLIIVSDVFYGDK